MIVTPVLRFSHNGRVYIAGESFELDEKQALQGLQIGILKAVRKSEEGSSPKDAPLKKKATKK